MLRRLKLLIISLASLLLLAWLSLARPFVFWPQKLQEIALADPVALENHVRKISLELSPRNSAHPENLDKVAEYISAEFRKTNSKVSLQTYPVGSTNYSNVVSEYGKPSDLGTVVIGAHFDAHDELPGADDNASGVAGLLELGRLLSKHTLPHKVLLVAYNLEEMPYFGTDKMGSAVHAASLVASGEKVRLMISLEMIGYFSEARGSQSYPLLALLNIFYPSRGDFLAIVGPFSLSRATVDIKRAFMNSVPLPVFSINAPSSVKGVDFSDHRSYAQKGYDAVMLTDTAFYRNRTYHTASDTPDRLNYDKMAQVVTGVYAYLLAEHS